MTLPMNSRLVSVLLVVVVVAGGMIVWRQQRVIDEWPRGRTVPASATTPAGAPAAPVETIDLGTPTPPLSSVENDVSFAGAPVRGRADARVVFVEYSDFQCPFCGRFQRETYPRLVRDYVDTGKVRYVFQQLPLESLHPNAMGAAIFATCSAAQGQFWPVHDRLFANQTALGAPLLMAYADGLGMDMAALARCVASDAPKAAINASRTDAIAAGFMGTPGFLVGTETPAGVLHAVRRVYGAAPYSLFQSAIEDVLAGK
jgi:protein-disulfide isomerase